MRCSGNAEQFTATNGAPRRGPPSWIARARSSFPVPVSPTIRAPALRCGRSREGTRSEEHTSELQSRFDLVCRLLLEKKKKKNKNRHNEKSDVKKDEVTL